jgi:hypothetical protein
MKSKAQRVRQMIHLTVRHFVHKGGTKDYDLYALTSDNTKGTVVRRWGALGSSGQVKGPAAQMSRGEAMRELDAETKNRIKRGYVANSEITQSFESLDELARFLPPGIWSRAQEYILPLDDDSMKAIDDKKDARFAEEAERKAKAAAARTLKLAEVRGNNWGSW